MFDLANSWDFTIIRLAGDLAAQAIRACLVCQCDTVLEQLAKGARGIEGIPPTTGSLLAFDETLGLILRD